MDNNELPQANREELLAQIENNLKAIELLEAEVKTLSWTDETLKAYKQMVVDAEYKVEKLTELVHENVSVLQGTPFFDEVVELFEIELTKYVTIQLHVSFEVQAQVPFDWEDSDIVEDLSNASLDYNHYGKAEIEDFAFGEIEEE